MDQQQELEAVKRILGRIALLSDNSPWFLRSIEPDLEDIRDETVKGVLTDIIHAVETARQKFYLLFLATQEYERFADEAFRRLIRLRDEETHRDEKGERSDRELYESARRFSRRLQVEVMRAYLNPEPDVDTSLGAIAERMAVKDV